MQKYQSSVIDQFGNCIPGVSITVRTLAGALAVIFSDNGVTPQANPFTTNSLGELSFYAADGRYRVTGIVNGQEVVLDRDVLLEDLADADDANFNIITANTANIGNLNVSGTSALAVITATALTVVGAIAGGSLSVIGSSTLGATVATTLTATGQVSLGGAAGSESLRVAPAPVGTVNWTQITGNVTGAAPLYRVEGADVDITARYRTKGAGSHFFETGGTFGNIGLGVAHTANAVNYLQVAGSAVGGAIPFQTVGVDANIGLSIASKGSAVIDFSTSSFANRQLRINPVANTVNYASVYGASTGNPPSVRGEGTDPNVSFGVYSKGTGTVFLAPGGLTALNAVGVTNAVSYVQVSNAVSGNSPRIESAGTDTNIPLVFSSKGTFGHGFYTGSFITQQFNISHASNAVNHVNVNGAATGNSPAVSAQGADGAINLIMASKGSAEVLLQTNSAIQFRVAGPASAVNYLRAVGAIAGSAAALETQGSDANVDLNLTPKGTGNIVAAAGNIAVNVAGRGLRVKEGSNAKQGTATLVAGSVVVSNTSVTANSRILLTSNVDGGTPGWLRVSARNAGVSFTITSSSSADTSTVAYQIFEPA